MDHKISILFYSRIVRKTKDNLFPIYLRITIDGKRIDQSINRFVEQGNLAFSQVMSKDILSCATISS